MNPLRIAAPLLLAGLLVTASPADACSALRSCVPGPSVSTGPYISIGRSSGTLHLQVEPAHAQVYVNGVYAGLADGFDGASDHARLTVGRYKVEVRAEGYTPIKFRAHIQKARTTVYRVALLPAADVTRP